MTLASHAWQRNVWKTTTKIDFSTLDDSLASGLYTQIAKYAQPLIFVGGTTFSNERLTQICHLTTLTKITAKLDESSLPHLVSLINLQHLDMKYVKAEVAV